MRTNSVVSFAAVLVATAVTLFAKSDADAHIEMTSPTPRYADLKSGPCGRGRTDARTKNVHTYKPGQTITVTWDETVPHPGHYRISFDPNGSSAFTDPKTADERSTAAPVLIDGIADKSGRGSYSQAVTLPNVECDTCTLQLVQVMTDKAPYGDGDDLYYQCADIILSNDAPGTDPAPASGSSGATTNPPAANEGGCATGAHHGAGGVGLLLAVTALGVIRRRQSRPSRNPTRGTPTRPAS